MRNLVSIAAALVVAALPAAAQDIDALERQLDKARDEAPMVIKSFMAVSRPAKHFGDYEQRSNTEYKRGEQLLFYGEPKNLLMPRKATGVIEPAFEVDLEVKPEKVDVLKQPNFMSMRLPSKSRIQDIYLNISLSLGQAPAGKYNIKFIVRDLNSKKSASVSQDVVIK
jgi:hypothetical protein